MASTKLCIELASREPRWSQFDVATKAAIAISKDCNDRQGLDLGGLDEELFKEIIDSWADIIRMVFEDD